SISAPPPPPPISLVWWSQSLPPGGVQIQRRSGWPHLALPNPGAPAVTLTLFSAGDTLVVRANPRGFLVGVTSVSGDGEASAVAGAAKTFKIAKDERVVSFTVFFTQEPFSKAAPSETGDPLDALVGRVVDIEFDTDKKRKSERLMDKEKEKDL